MKLDIRDARLRDLIDPDVALETLSDGHLFTEGPLWDVERRRLLFSDIPSDRIHEWRCKNLPGRMVIASGTESWQA